jgi:DNA-binding CsgD family transcriptional regulator/tetratricopeptide (TPR) repeat protein
VTPEVHTIQIDRAPLVGRDRELEIVREQVRRHRAVAVIGEPGIGKTRLLAELGDSRVYRGSATHLDRQLPYGVFVSALDEHLDDLAEELADDQLAVLAEVFPELAGRVPPRPSDKERLFQAVTALLAARPEPAVLVLDDLQLADESSLELLDYLLRHQPERLAVALAYRPRQAGPALRAVTSRAVSSGRAVRLRLGPLSEEQIAELVGDSPDLFRESGGNPFYAHALRHMPSDLTMPAGTELPIAVRTAIARELAALDRTDRKVFQAAAVAGETVDVSTVAAIAGIGEPATQAAMCRLGEADLVRSMGHKRRWRHRHPVLRAVAYATADPGWRTAAHAAAAAELTGRGAPSVMAAHHLERTARVGDETAANVFLAAATVSMPTAPATAAHWIRAALRVVADVPGNRDRRVDLRLWLATALGLAGRIHDSRAVLHDMLPQLTRGSRQRALAMSLCARMEHLLGQLAEANALLTNELSAMPEQATPSAVALKLELATNAVMSGNLGGTRADEALAAARQLADPAYLACAIGVHAVHQQASAATTVDIGDQVTEAAALLDGLTDASLLRRLDACVWVGTAETHLNRIVEARHHFRRALKVGRATGQTQLIPFVLHGIGTTYEIVGQLAEAAAHSDEAAKVARSSGLDEILFSALAQRAWVLAWMGETTTARALTDEAVTLANKRYGRLSSSAYGMLAQARWFTGDADGCRQTLLTAGGGPGLPRFYAFTRAAWLALFAEAAVATNDQAGADEAASAAEALAAAQPEPHYIGWAQFARAWALSRTDPATAASHALTSAQAFHDSGRHVSEGRARLLAATTLDAAGEHERAVEQFTTAHSLFTACGARMLADQATYRRAQVKSRAAVDLSDRELQVARLIVTGHTNQTIAAKLYLSTRTIESLVAHLRRKLGVPSRAAIAAAVTGHLG